MSRGPSFTAPKLKRAAIGEAELPARLEERFFVIRRKNADVQRCRIVIILHKIYSRADDARKWYRNQKVNGFPDPEVIIQNALEKFPAEGGRRSVVIVRIQIAAEDAP